MGLFQEKKRVTTEAQPNQELADAYEPIAILHEQLATLAAKIETMEGVKV